jgi:AbrB family looped-hinge helix DNA binding protein
MDDRGQLVIPKDVREELSLNAGVGFILYALDTEAILLKPIHIKEFSDQRDTVRELEANESKLKLSNKSIESAKARYKTKSKHQFDEV